MKIYITNYSDELLSNKSKNSIFVHTNKNCKKLNDDYWEGKDYKSNSGITEKNFHGKEKLYSNLVLLGKFIPCKECEEILFAKDFEDLRSAYKKETEFINDAIQEYDKIIYQNKYIKIQFTQ